MHKSHFLPLSLSLSLCFFALLAVSFSLLFCPLNLTYFAPYVSVSISIIVLYMYPLIFSLLFFYFDLYVSVFLSIIVLYKSPLILTLLIYPCCSLFASLSARSSFSFSLHEVSFVQAKQSSHITACLCMCVHIQCLFISLQYFHLRT